MSELLLELFSEEIPARMQARAAEDLQRLMTEKLHAAGLHFTLARTYVTPRRLTLVIEEMPSDQADVREVVKASLSGLGYRVLTAPDGPAGLRILESDEPIDLLLTDVVMPNGMTGIEQEARRLRADIRIVVISGYFKELQAGVPLAGVVFLKKPFMHADLAEKIESALARR